MSFQDYVSVAWDVTTLGLGVNVHDSGDVPRISRFGWVAIGFSSSPYHLINWSKWVDFMHEINYLPAEIPGADTIWWSLYSGCVLHLYTNY